MGYYTSFALQIDRNKASNLPGELDSTEVMEAFRMTCDYAAYALNQNGEPIDSVKWYSHENDLKAFSKQYPDWLFTLNGDGEESGDMWVKYFYRGKMQRASAQITFDIFDESKLK